MSTPPRCPAPVRLLMLMLLPCLVIAQPSGGNFELSRQVIAGGGTTVEGAEYRLSGTLGQAVTGMPAEAGIHRVQGGFHRAAADADRIFTNGFESL